MMEKQILNFIDKHNMLAHGDGVIVGFSGGADSAALLHFLAGLRGSMGLRLFAVHVHHGLRGAAADRDADFCADFCSGLGIEFRVVRADAAGKAKEMGKGIEAAGRALRYEIFGEIVQELGFDKIAAGHNKNDIAETVLMQMLRGAARMRGIAPVVSNVVRPLLNISRSDILSYCAENNLKFCDDETNFEKDYTRNKIRLDLIPHLEKEYNPNLINTLVRMAQISQEEDSHPQKAAKRRGIYRQLADFYGDAQDISFEHVESVLRLEGRQSGKMINLPGGVVAQNVYGEIVIKRYESAGGLDMPLPFEQEIFVQEAGYWFYLGKKPKERPGKKTFTKMLSCDIIDDIRLRRRAAGDKIYFENVGTKKIKNYFIDKKVPRDERDRAVLAAFGSDVILILSGEGAVWSDKFNTADDTDCAFLQVWGDGLDGN